MNDFVYVTIVKNENIYNLRTDKSEMSTEDTEIIWLIKALATAVFVSLTDEVEYTLNRENAKIIFREKFDDLFV